MECQAQNPSNFVNITSENLLIEKEPRAGVPGVFGMTNPNKLQPSNQTCLMTNLELTNDVAAANDGVPVNDVTPVNDGPSPKEVTTADDRPPPKEVTPADDRPPVDDVTAANDGPPVNFSELFHYCSDEESQGKKKEKRNRHHRRDKLETCLLCDKEILPAIND